MIKATDLFKPASPEEVAKRRAAYPEIRMKEELDEVKKTKLPDGTWHVHDDFGISGGGLTTLKNLNISIVDGDFYCHYNNLTTLEGAPKEVGNDFWCYHNNLTNLKGAPKVVPHNFYCNDNSLTSLEGIPKEIYGCLYCYNNKVQFTEGAIRVICNVRREIVC